MGGTLSDLKNAWPAVVQVYPPKSTFSVEQIPDLTGRVALVTGGNSGLGYETIKALLQHNAKVYLAARTKEKADSAIASLKEATGKEAIFHELDLGSLAKTKKSAEDFLAREPELHILYSNAGVMFPPIDWLHEDGYDLQWGTNIVAPFLFTELLLPALLSGVKTSPDHHARIVTTSSCGAYLHTINWDTFRDGPTRRQKTPEELYYQSKHANVVVARQLAKRYADQGIISISVNPGNINTELHRHVPSFQRKIMELLLLYPAPDGALTQLFAGTMPEALNYNGEFLIPWARLGRCREEAYDDAVGERLWNLLKDEIKPYTE